MREKVRIFFDDNARDYDGKYERIDCVRSFIFSERKRIVLDMLDKKAERLLDIGCGPGVYTAELSEKCRALYGVDISSEMIELAKEKGFKNTAFSVGSIERLDFGDGFFDAAVCVGVLEYLDDVECGIKEISRTLKSGGVAIFTAPNASSILNKLDYLMRSVLKKVNKVAKIDTSKSFMDYDFQPRLLHYKTLENLLAKYCFRIEEARFHIFRVSFLNRLWPGLSLFLAKKFNFISNRHWAINCVVKARKIDGAT